MARSSASVDEWDLVIKVKHGDTLRRISAYAVGQCMDHDIGKLRAKIINLFKFSEDADLILTYTDEDGDVVTLDDDDELRDAIVGQRLNPLRINVQLKPNSSSFSGSPQLETPLNAQTTVVEPPKSIPEPVINALSDLFSVAQKTVTSSSKYAQVDELMKSEPVKSAISKLSKDVMKTASTSPTFGQLVEVFSKLGLSDASQSSGPTGESLGVSSEASTHLMDLNVTDEPRVSNDPPILSSETISVTPDRKQKNVSDDAEWTVFTAPGIGNTEASKIASTSQYSLEQFPREWPAKKIPELEKEGGNSRRNGKSVATTETNYPAPAWISGESVPIYGGGFTDISGGFTTKQSPVQTQFVSPSQTGLDAQFGPPPISPMREQVLSPPFTHLSSSRFGPPVTRELGVLPTDVLEPHWSCPMYPPVYPRSHSYNENTQRAFHRGVQCDGCGMHPIVGPRFKSNVMEDYDLCNICFTQTGNKSDYTRIDRSPQRAPKLLKDFHKHHLRYRTPSCKVLHGCGVRPSRTKLESCFIKDVTVLDGTVMPPSTRFTKIWRMRNNGTVAWPLGTQLVWVGGDQFGDRVSANLEITANGFPVDNELDIAVDFTAPSRPGRYVSYWKMASPSRHRFGQRVWVLIQVDYSRPNSADGSNSFNPNFNLNLPPESSSRNESGIIDVNAEPLDSEIPGATEEMVNKPVVVDVPNSLVDVTIGELPKTTPEQIVSNTSSTSLIDLPVTPVVEKGAAPSDLVEETLLKELEEMGFRQIDLNKEILRLNEYDLELSVDDLCGFAEWDPLLSELHEMGFYDNELNKKMLIKNGGSIKRAVLDLIAGEKPE